MEIEESDLKCYKCKETESQHGFEFYLTTSKDKTCSLALCVLCNQKEKLCPICNLSIASHRMKTRFSYAYKQALEEEDRKISQQIECRRIIEQKWEMAKNEIQRYDYKSFDLLLEYLEEAIQSKYQEDDKNLILIAKKIENLLEQCRKQKRDSMEEEIHLNRPPPAVIGKPKPHQQQSNKNLIVPVPSGFSEKDYFMRKFFKFF